MTETKWYASRTKSKHGSWGVFTKDGSYSVFDAAAPGIDSEANARLIASAPELFEELKKERAIKAELLEALRGLYGLCPIGHREEAAGLWADARAAIAKAEKGVQS